LRQVETVHSVLSSPPKSFHSIHNEKDALIIGLSCKLICITLPETPTGNMIDASLFAFSSSVLFGTPFGRWVLFSRVPHQPNKALWMRLWARCPEAGRVPTFLC
jgi:hypothetical protein